MKKVMQASGIWLLLAGLILTAHCKEKEPPNLGENLCVINPTGVCTQDINVCGNSSVCNCPEGYEYNNIIGKCLIKDITQGKPQGPIPESKCAIKPTMGCTKDINPCGHPSRCECGMGANYDPRSGLCLRFFKEEK